MSYFTPHTTREEAIQGIQYLLAERAYSDSEITLIISYLPDKLPISWGQWANLWAGESAKRFASPPTPTYNNLPF